MSKTSILFSILVGVALFVYLVSSFLVATFDISLWKDEQRFFAVLVYLLFIWGIPQALAEPTQHSAFKKKKEGMNNGNTNLTTEN